MEWYKWIEVLWWYDGLSHYEDDQWNKFSRVANIPMSKDELGRFWKIYKVRWITEFEYEILSERKDE